MKTAHTTTPEGLSHDKIDVLREIRIGTFPNRRTRTTHQKMFNINYSTPTEISLKPERPNYWFENTKEWGETKLPTTKTVFPCFNQVFEEKRVVLRTNERFLDFPLLNPSLWNFQSSLDSLEDQVSGCEHTCPTRLLCLPNVPSLSQTQFVLSTTGLGSRVQLPEMSGHDRPISCWPVTTLWTRLCQRSRMSTP